MMITTTAKAIALPLPLFSLTHLFPIPSLAVAQRLWRSMNIPQEIVAELIKAIATPLTSWLDQHPLVVWAIHHPFISLGVFAILLLLTWSLFQAFVEILQELWLHVLKVPLHLGRWMLRGIFRVTVYPIIKAVSRTTGIDQLPRSNSSAASFSPLLTPPEPSLVDLDHGHETSSGNHAHPYVYAPALTDTTVLPLVEATCPSPIERTDESETIVQLLHQLEKLTYEQNQILHRIACLTENNHPSA